MTNENEMKICPYCGKDIGNRIHDTDFEINEEGDYMTKDNEKGYYIDYIVTCPSCNGGFYWTELFKRITTVITNADTNEETKYKP